MDKFWDSIPFIHEYSSETHTNNMYKITCTKMLEVVWFIKVVFESSKLAIIVGDMTQWF